MSVIRLRRRLRRNPQIRNLVAETRLRAEDMILPYFVIGGKDRREPIMSMPGIYRLSAYNVSGEYSMIKKMSAGDRTKKKELVFESLTSIRRAGTDLIITYFGKEVARWLR